MFDNITYNQALIVCIVGLIVIFVVWRAIKSRTRTAAQDTWHSYEMQDITAAPEAESAAAPVTADSHIDVVLITAAVAAYLGADSSSFVVRSIRRIGTEETAWTRAGRLDSLQ